MPEKKVKFPLPDGKVIDAYEVPVEETIERWTEVKLEDGSVLKIKQAVITVTRLDGQYDPEGNPLYALKATPLIVVEHTPQHLHRKVQ